MKKLSILVALILCVTIGGVYATWTYAGATTETQHKHFTHDLAGYTTTTAKGIITIDTTNLTVKIDDTNVDFYGELVITGSIKVTFTPNAGASVNTLDLQWKLGSTGSAQYNNKDIYSIDTTVQTLTGVGANGVEISADTISTLLKLNGDLYLPEYTDYQTVETALAGLKLGIYVGESIS